MCSVRWDLATDGVTIAAGANNGEGSRIVLRDKGGDQRLDLSGRSTPAPGDGDSFRRECDLPWQLGPMPTIPIAPHVCEREQELPSDAPIEKITHNATDPDRDERELEVRDRGEGEDQGRVPERPSVVVPERTHARDQVSEGAHHRIWSGRPRGECRCPGSISCINAYQFQRMTPRIQRLVLPSLSLMPQRCPQVLQKNP